MEKATMSVQEISSYKINFIRYKCDDCLYSFVHRTSCRHHISFTLQVFNGFIPVEIIC